MNFQKPGMSDEVFPVEWSVRPWRMAKRRSQYISVLLSTTADEHGDILSSQVTKSHSTSRNVKQTSNWRKTWKWKILGSRVYVKVGNVRKKKKKSEKGREVDDTEVKIPNSDIVPHPRVRVRVSEGKKFHVTKSNAWHETRGETRKDRAYPRLMQNTKREKKLKTKSKRDYVRINVFYREQVAERGKSGNHVYRWLSPTSTHHDCYDGETWSATRTSMRWRVYLRIDICSIVNHANSTFFVPLSRFEALNKKLHFLRQKFV